MINLFKEEQLPMIKKVKPKFFACTCKVCKRKFKNEEGFKIKKDDTFSFPGEVPVTITEYICSNCAKTIEEVKKKINDI